jgi:DNA-binding winged helix-turn-helix (wHTH) protein
VFSDPGQTQFAQAGAWLQHYPASGTVWLLGGQLLPRRIDAPPKARRMLLFMLNRYRYRELDEPGDGVVVSLAELKRVLWPEDADPQLRADSAVANVAWELRPVLGDEDQRMLQTVRDEGYRLIPRPKV